VNLSITPYYHNLYITAISLYFLMDDNEIIRGDKDISALFMGKQVTVTSKEWGKRDLTPKRGTVTGLEPRMYLNLVQNGTGGHIVFCGAAEGIVKIEDGQGKVLYENRDVEEAYKYRQNDENKRNALREKGVFYQP
jgi:hypothetical protein